MALSQAKPARKCRQPTAQSTHHVGLFLPIQLHLLNANGQFDSIRERVESCFEQSLEEINARLSIENVDVVVSVDPQRAIPQLGVGGHSPSGNCAFLTIDPDNPKFTDGFESAFKRLLAHELHHCARWSGPGYGNTLAEAIISEGLACMFEAEICEGEIPFYAQALPPDQVVQLRARAADLLFG